MTEEKSPEEIIDADMDRIDELLKRLDIEYNIYFQGARKKTPDDFKRMLDGLIRRYRNIYMRRYAHRFRFASIMTKYAAYTERWGKRLREMELKESGLEAQRTSAQTQTVSSLLQSEEGVSSNAAAARAETSARADYPQTRENKHLIKDVESDNEAIQTLFNEYVKAKSDEGEDVSKFKMAAFKKALTKQFDALKAKGVQTAEFQIETKDGKVKVKAGKAK